jgi:hypothetical protein
MFLIFTVVKPLQGEAPKTGAMTHTAIENSNVAGVPIANATH